mgnify:CR=1 FL=1
MIKIIIVILDRHKIPEYLKKTIIDIEANKKVEIIQILEIAEKKKKFFSLKLISKILLKLLLGIEKLFIKKLIETSQNIELNIQKYKIKKINPIRKKYIDRFNTIDINKIKKLKPDIILNFTDRLIKGEILDIAKYGMLGFHYADTDFQRNGLGGFFEIIERQKYSGVTLQKYNEKIDGGLVVYKGYYKTLNFFTLNHQNLLNKTSKIFQNTIRLILDKNLNYTKQKKYDKKLYPHPPSVINIIKYIFFAYLK